MAKLNPPHSTAVVDVRKEDVDRYRAAGWTEVQSESKSTPKKRKASSDERDEQ